METWKFQQCMKKWRLGNFSSACRAYYSRFSNVKSRRYNRYLACINIKFGSGESENIFEPLGSRTVYDIGTDYFRSPTVTFFGERKSFGLAFIALSQNESDCERMRETGAAATHNIRRQYLTSCLPRKGRNTMALTIGLSRSFAVSHSPR